MSNTNHETKEIDLLELFNIIGKSIKNAILSIYKTIVFLISFGLKKAHWLALITIAGALIGYLVYLGTDRYYSSALIAQPNGISAIDIVEYINDLNRYTTKNNEIALKQALEITDTVAKKVKNIQAFLYIDLNHDGRGDIIDFKQNYDPKDTTQILINSRFYLKVEVLDNRVFSDVRDGLFIYINKNPYLIKLNQIRKRELEELISSTDREIAKLDSLQNVDYFTDNLDRLTARNQSSLLFLSEKDKQLYYKDKLSLEQQRLRYIKELELSTTPITVLKDFTQLTVEENPKGFYIIRFGYIIGLLGYIFLIVFEYRKKL